MSQATDQEQMDLHAIDDSPAYRLYISPDRVRILLDCPNPHHETANLIQRVLADFKLLEIPEYPDADILSHILKSSCQPGEDLLEHTIMMGQAVSPAHNGRLEWARDFFAGGWEVDDKTGAIDFWAKCESRAVSEGELLVSLHHPIEGIPGLNVFGNEIPVTKPLKVKLRSGKNVTLVEEEGRISYQANCAGRVRYADGVVAVDDVYVIKGDVSLETGNVVHSGAVMIHGDVGAGASLEIDGDIIVKGMLEPCNIQCGGSLTVAGGIVGEENRRIDLAGDLVARYISEANLEVGGNILVGNEIAHSHIRCLGSVHVPQGRIAGGSTVALKGIQISEAGASGTSLTHLTAGLDHTLNPKLMIHKDKIIRLEEALEKIQGAFSLNHRKQNDTPENRQSQKLFKQKIHQISQAIEQESNAIVQLKDAASELAVEEIIITKELWSGTTIQLNKTKVLVRNSVLKPRIAYKKRRKVMISPLGDGNMPTD